MELIPWVLAGLFAGLAVYLAFRPPRGLPPEPVDDPRSKATGKDGAVEDSDDVVLRGMARYLGTAVLSPLEDGLRKGDTRGAVEDAVDALRDLAFHAQVETESAVDRENLISVIQGVTREYSLETGTAIKFISPNRPVHVVLASERFKDALFLILVNAGHFSRGQTVEVIVEEKESQAEIRIRDQGPGFSEEALLKACEPFWTTESDALGLGLFQAKKLLEGQGVAVDVGNSGAGGGDVVISLRYEQ
jgi:signal transduction histidine kinase